MKLDDSFQNAPAACFVVLLMLLLFFLLPYCACGNLLSLRVTSHLQPPLTFPRCSECLARHANELVCFMA